MGRKGEMSIMKLVTVFTCYNRCNKTRRCIETLVEGNPSCEFHFVAVDDNSVDGTLNMLKSMKDSYVIDVITGTGSLFYSGGMRLGMKYVLDELKENYDYLLIVNDDVNFYQHSIEKMIKQSSEFPNAVIVGATCSKENKLTYGAIKYDKGNKYHTVEIQDYKNSADTFNANCVLIPFYAFKQAGPIDEHYIHSLGDFDYGLMLKNRGYEIISTNYYVGICEDNALTNTWKNTNISRMKRIRIKESPKGLPSKQWFYFLKKNFGILLAIKGCITPYIRILIGK